MKKLYWLLATLMIASLVLTACGGSEAPAAEEPMAEEPAAEESVAEEPAAEEPAAEEPGETEGPAPAADGKWCSGTDIVFFPGGSPGGPFATVVYNGAVQAAEDLGANMETVWSDWNPEN